VAIQLTYPEDFPQRSRAKVELALEQAEVDFGERNMPNPAFVHLSPAEVAKRHIDLERRTKQLVADVLFVFAEEACDLGRQGRWSAERIRTTTEDFLHQMAVRAYFDRRAGAGCGREVFESELKAEIETSGRWKEYRQQRLAIAKGQAATPQASNTQPAEWPAQRWEDIEIRFLSEERVQIFVNGRPGDTKNFAEMGFEDHRGKGGKPRQAWHLLKVLSANDGIFPVRGISGHQGIQKRAQELRDSLSKHFRIAGDPLPFVEGIGYKTRCKISRSPAYQT
jgi:hypothetical protein